MNTQELVSKIIASDHKVVLSITGGGTSAISQLVKTGGASNILLEASVPYNQASFKSYVGFLPEKLVSSGASRALAMTSYMRGIKLTEEKTVIGLACTATLAKNESEREGRLHQACISYQKRDTTVSATFKLPHLGREIEEELVAKLTLQMLGDACNVTKGEWKKDYEVSLIQEFERVAGDENIVKVLHKELDYTFPKGTPEKLDSMILFPGSFNPKHLGHEEIQEQAEKDFEEVLFEISITNVDKPPLDYIELNKRLKQFKNNIVITNAPLMLEKFKILPIKKAVIGYDTYLRLISTTYYDNSQIKMENTLKELLSLGISFLVVPRNINGQIKKLIDTKNKLFSPFVGVFNYLDISSSAIRRNNC